MTNLDCNHQPNHCSQDLYRTAKADPETTNTRGPTALSAACTRHLLSHLTYQSPALTKNLVPDSHLMGSTFTRTLREARRVHLPTSPSSCRCANSVVTLDGLSL